MNTETRLVHGTLTTILSNLLFANSDARQAISRLWPTMSSRSLFKPEIDTVWFLWLRIQLVDDRISDESNFGRVSISSWTQRSSDPATNAQKFCSECDFHYYLICVLLSLANPARVGRITNQRDSATRAPTKRVDPSGCVLAIATDRHCLATFALDVASDEICRHLQ